MYNLDYLQKLYELLVPDKRTPSVIAFNVPAFSELQSIHNDLFITYKNFQACADWNNTTTYAKGDLVKYKKAIYRSLKGDNFAAIPIRDIERWVLVSPNFFGVDNRLKIRGEKLIFEYALNLWFGSRFRQPTEGGLSDIYIENNTETYQSPFKVGKKETQSSKVSTRESVDFIGLDYVFSEKYNFTIFVPTTVFTALGTDDQIRKNVIRDFADRYTACGLIYKIQTY